MSWHPDAPPNCGGWCDPATALYELVSFISPHQTTSPALMNRVLIDTHCHVHVSLNDGTETAETGYRTALGQHTDNCCNTPSEEGRDEEVADECDEDDHGSARVTMYPLHRVVHITMGIKEDDWLGAVRFAAADNLR